MASAGLNPERVAARERVAVVAGAALLAAGSILVGAILPAEYGVDPLGIGARLGLTAIGDVQQKIASFEANRAAGAGGVLVVAPQERPYHDETVTFAVGSGNLAATSCAACAACAADSIGCMSR